MIGRYTQITLRKIYDPISKSIIKYKNHPSIVKINDYIIIDSYFNFIPVLIEDLTEVVSHMGINKASQTNNIPPKILKENVDICSYFFLTNVNNCILEAEFPDNLKLAEIFSSFKKGDPFLRIIIGQ